MYLLRGGPDDDINGILPGNEWPRRSKRGNASHVEQRRYRFRILNASNTHILILRMENGLPFRHIGSDGGFLPQAAQSDRVMIFPSERADVIVDFSDIRPGSRITLLNIGREKIVYVAMGNGYFDRRLVATGWRLDGQTQIISGLSEGERVVTSGSFLVDSESRVARGVGAGQTSSLNGDNYKPIFSQ